ncbi:MAG: SoxR reducing system RseC family protein [Gammaproteobacteria bacterium]|nr:SoxR reducing system RseC family protein [Gammaproteobacteria bacterium]
MIEQPALVAAARRHKVWVRSCAATHCHACATGRGCGAGWLLRCFAVRASEPLVIKHSGPLAAGDRVILSVPERWLLTAAAAVYGAPLLGLLAGAALGDSWGQDLGAMVLGGVGFTVGAALTVALSARLAKACPLSVRAAPRETRYIR